jgi:hypothetical protein
MLRNGVLLYPRSNYCNGACRCRTRKAPGQISFAVLRFSKQLNHRISDRINALRQGGKIEQIDCNHGPVNQFSHDYFLRLGAHTSNGVAI